VGALGHCAIARLSQSFALVPQKLQNTLADLQRLVYPNANYKHYRTTLASAVPPILPIQGVTLKDLTSIEELPTISGKHVHFDKLECIAAIVGSFRGIQCSTPYCFVVESLLRHFLKSLVCDCCVVVVVFFLLLLFFFLEGVCVCE
jgi:RasGEF domain